MKLIIIPNYDLLVYIILNFLIIMITTKKNKNI
jgi:hypothetical protein